MVFSILYLAYFNEMISLRFFLAAFVLLGLGLSCTTSRSVNKLPEVYVPVDQPLYDTLVIMDSILFDAFNNCRLEVFSELFSDDHEFYHDKGGLTTSKAASVNALKNNICGKVRRELVKGSIEVYPIPNYGAVQIGLHRFYNNQDPPGTPSPIGKFIHTWKRENGHWRITRVISLHEVGGR